jgi:hypothetical protein
VKVKVRVSRKLVLTHDKRDSWKIYALFAVLLAVFIFTKIKFLNWRPF